MSAMLSHWLVAGLVPLALVFGLRGAWHLWRVARDPEGCDAALGLLRGIRGVVVAVGTLCVAAGLGYGDRGSLLFGLVFLGEEIYETGLVLLILRCGRGLLESPVTEVGCAGSSRKPCSASRARSSASA